MQHCTLEIRDEDRHAMTAIGSDVLSLWIGRPGIGAYGGQQERPRGKGQERASDAQHK